MKTAGKTVANIVVTLFAASGALLLLGMSAPTANAGETKINTGYFGNVAIKGFDPVAYFTQGKAVKGSERYKLKWLGAYWHFSSAEHRELFKSKPQSYAPQYGGHCATGLAIHGGLTRDIDPEAWKQEMDGVSEFFRKFGDRLPLELWAQHESLKMRLEELGGTKS